MLDPAEPPVAHFARERLLLQMRHQVPFEVLHAHQRLVADPANVHFPARVRLLVTLEVVQSGVRSVAVFALVHFSGVDAFVAAQTLEGREDFGALAARQQHLIVIQELDVVGFDLGSYGRGRRRRLVGVGFRSGLFIQEVV